MTVRGVRLEACCVAASLSLFLVLAGCGGDGFGSELKVQPTPRPLSRGDYGTVRLPQDEPFSIALAPTQKEAGLGGTAEADAHVSKGGSADALARVENGGSARAWFQLGHAFENDSDRQAELRVRVRGEFETDAQVTSPGPLPDAKVGLKLYARDGRNRLLRDFCLTQHSTDKGAAASTDRKEVDFVLLLGPRERVTVFLAGSAEVETGEGRSAHGSIKLSGVEMEVTTELAPPVGRAGDGQG
jgi:hypothetical protein